MQSDERILTTHCGSLPRPPQLSDLLLRQEAGEPIDERRLHHESAERRGRGARAQIDAGIDIVSDGEQPRVGFSMYVPLRMEGFGGESIRPYAEATSTTFHCSQRAAAAEARTPQPHLQSAARPSREVSYTGRDAARDECDMFAPRSRASAEARRDIHDRRLARHHRDHDG